KIPVLVDDDYAITESLAINLYLARKFSGEVSPATDEEWGRTFQWKSWVLDEVDKDIQKATLLRCGACKPNRQRLAVRIDSALRTALEKDPDRRGGEGARACALGIR